MKLRRPGTLLTSISLAAILAASVSPIRSDAAGPVAQPPSKAVVVILLVLAGINHHP